MEVDLRLLMGVLVCMGCSDGGTDPGTPVLNEVSVMLGNSGEASLEGHTPRGFEGMGSGIFVGDEINAGFPGTDGVQIFLTIPLDEAIPSNASVTTAFFAGEPTEVRGTPFADLGSLVVDEMRFLQFGSQLWDRQPVDGGVQCVFASSSDGPFGCDIAAAVQRAVDDERDGVQLRLRFETAGDDDGVSDLVLFHDGDSNATALDLFHVDVMYTTP